MSQTRITIERAGPLTTVQAGGRAGYMRFGVPHSGPVDRLAFAAAHAALGNPPGSALIELSLGGIALSCTGSSVGFVLCGADFTADIDGALLGAWCLGTLEPGMRLRIREGGQGNWAYLAFGGDLRAEAWLGSQSTHFLANLGGGRVSARQELVVDTRFAPAEARLIPQPPNMDRLEEAMIVLGPQDRYFPAAEVAQLTGTTFAASARFDRMGRVLEGTPLVPSRLDIVSEPAVRGSLQIDGEGKLTMLSADHQTTGGYPKIATVAGAHVDRIAQLESESPLRFRAVSVEQATAEWRRHAAMAEAYLKGVGAPLPPLGTRLLEANLIDGVVDARR